MNFEKTMDYLNRNGLSLEEMIRLTKSEDCADHPLTTDKDMYLAWNDMQWIMDGQVTEMTMSKEELCFVPEESHFLLLNCNY